MGVLVTVVRAADAAQGEARSVCQAALAMALFAEASAVRAALEALLDEIRARFSDVWPAACPAPTVPAPDARQGEAGAAEDELAPPPVIAYQRWTLPCCHLPL